MHSYTIHCLSEALSPISHMSGTVGNEGIVAREKAIVDGHEREIPHLSGNALRHRAVRQPGAHWLIDRYDLHGKLTKPQQHFLLNGGRLYLSSSHENTRRIAEMHEFWPLLKLCGGSLPDQILAGSMDAWRGTLICEENRQTLAKTLPVPLPQDRLLSAEAFLTNAQYTRGDASRSCEAGEPIDSKDEDEESSLMIFSGQCVARGAMFHHGFMLRHQNELEIGALLFSLRLWQASGGTIGGAASRGHGRLATEIYAEGIDQDALVEQYIDHALSVKEDAVKWLHAAFAPKKKKAKATA